MNLWRLLSLTGLVSVTIASTLFTGHIAAASFDLNEGGFDLPAGGAALINLSFEWNYEGDNNGDELGHSVGAAGDVNGDGFSDIIVGSPGDTIEIDKAGAVYVFHGSAAGPNRHSSNWVAEGEQKGSRFGAAAGTAGDVNGDGYSDVIVGAYRYKNEQREEGKAYLYLGSEAGLVISPTWTFESDQIDAQLGFAVGAAGDVNGDGYDDVIIGARWYSENDGHHGRAYVFYGSDTGLAEDPDWTADSDRASAGFGSSVGTAGDVNGDGYDDVLIGAPEYDDDPEDEGGGAVFGFYGSEEGLSPTPDWVVIGAEVGARLGASVNTADDVNNDGLADVIVGVPEQDMGQPDTGAAFIFHGSEAGLSQIPNRTVSAGQSNSDFGIAVGSAGDFNGDGFDDVIVGAQNYTGDQSTEGAVFIFPGSATGVSPAAAWVGEGNKADTEFGFAAGLAGDVNRDGYSDVIVGAPIYKIQTDPYGRAVLFLGAAAAVDTLQPRVFLPLILKGFP